MGVCSCRFAQVPSGFLLGDALCLLDTKFEKGLLIPGARQTKGEKALQEAKRMKRLLGSLRHLYRNSFLAKTVREN